MRLALGKTKSPPFHARTRRFDGPKAQADPRLLQDAGSCLAFGYFITTAVEIALALSPATFTAVT